MRPSGMILFASLFFAGCSTAPIANTLDLVHPARPPKAGAPTRGGVCNPTPVMTTPPPGSAPVPAVAAPVAEDRIPAPEPPPAVP